MVVRAGCLGAEGASGAGHPLKRLAALVGVGLMLVGAAVWWSSPASAVSPSDVAGQPVPFGAVQSHGSVAGMNLAAPIAGMAATPDGGGYWLVAADGGVFSYGDAHFYGSLGGVHLAAPIVGIAAANAGGYWLAGADVGVFSFGDAAFHGSVPGQLSAGQSLAAPVVSMAASGAGGYWLAGADGGVFSFGSAAFYGSMGGQAVADPITAIATDRAVNGYWLLPTSPPPAAPTCTAGQLAASAYQGSGGGGQEAVVVVFRNRSSTACQMTGYPTAWFIDRSQARISAVSVDQSAPAPQPVTLAPGGEAATTVATQNPSVPDPSYCQPRTAAGVEVVPPSQTTSLAAPITITICTAHSSVTATPVTAGSSQNGL